MSSLAVANGLLLEVRGHPSEDPAQRNSEDYAERGALAALKVQGDMRTYYKGKVGEGKNKMSVLNAVRNKIIHRVFAVVRDGRKYEKKISQLLHEP